MKRWIYITSFCLVLFNNTGLGQTDAKLHTWETYNLRGEVKSFIELTPRETYARHGVKRKWTDTVYFLFDKEGRRIKGLFQDGYKTRFEKGSTPDRLTFDQEGRLSVREKAPYLSFGPYHGVWYRFEYDANDSIISYEIRSKEVLHERQVFIRDVFGRKVLKKIFYSKKDGSIYEAAGYYKWTYLPSQIVETYHHMDKILSHRYYDLDSLGRLICLDDKTEVRPELSDLIGHSYAYNEFGDLSEDQWYFQKQRKPPKRWRYEYDERGNWIKKFEIKLNPWRDDGSTVEQFKQERIIEYW